MIHLNHIPAHERWGEKKIRTYNSAHIKAKNEEKKERKELIHEQEKN